MRETKRIIAENLKKYRESSGLQQKEVAEMIGVRSNTLSNWENEKNSIDIETLLVLCEIYKVTLDDMYGVKFSAKKEPAPETDSLEWLRQGLLETGVIKNSDELSERQLEAIFGVMEIFVKNLKKVNEK